MLLILADKPCKVAVAVTVCCYMSRMTKGRYHIYADNLQPFLGSYIATMATQTWTNLCRMILRLKVLLMHGDYLKQTQLMCQIASHLRAVRK